MGYTAYECEVCGNDERFKRVLTIREPFEKQDDGDWAGDHAREEVLEVLEVDCVECDDGGIVY